MTHESDLTFGPFRLDTVHGRVWRGERVTPLRPRSLALLRYLLQHPGRLVTKAELRQSVWGGTHVTDTVLRVCVQEIRAALRDSATAPHYLETVGRQGYRFLLGGDPATPPGLTHRPIVGRRGEVAAFERRFQVAAHGVRQLIFVSGEAGVGKSTVVDLFLARLDVGSTVRIARGQCVEHYGQREPYLPILEALGQLSRDPGRQDVVAALRRFAPMWLVQLPGLMAEAELERLQRQVQGTTPARMLREFAEVLEVLTVERPLVLVLEDLHWSDHSTVEVLAYVAQRRVPARLLVLGTYRPVEMVIREHPLRGMVQELYGRGQVVEERLELLPAEDVVGYMAERLEGSVAVPLAAFIHARTEGNALFMVNIVEHLVQQGALVKREGEWQLRQGNEARVASLPERLQQFLMRRIEDLLPERRQVLEAASVVGEEFTVEAVAAGAGCPVEEVDAVCERLVLQHHFIDGTGPTRWVDGTRGGGYRFQHALYQQILYEQLGATRRTQLHRSIGRRLEASYGARAGDIAPQLAVHFERGDETDQAVHYWQQAGEMAGRRNAYREAIAALTKGLELLATLPDSPERPKRELMLQLSLGELLMAAQGMKSSEAGEVYTRAYGLSRQVGETPQRFRALSGLFLFHCAQGRLSTGCAFGRQFFDLATRQHDPTLVGEGHSLMGVLALYRGDQVAARTHLEQSLECSTVTQSSTPIFAAGLHLKSACLIWLMRTLWLLGYADQARQCSQEVLILAQRIEHTPTLAYAEYYTTTLYQHCRDAVMTCAHAEALMVLTDEQGFATRLEQGRILRGWVLAMQGNVADGVAQMNQGLAAQQRLGGPQLARPYTLALAAEGYGQQGQPETGLQVLADALALVAATGECWWAAELHRLKGTLMLQLPIPDVQQAEASFQQALDIARTQQAKALELRAALSLGRLWQQQGKRAAARDLLAPICDWFSEGFDTSDLQEAKTLLSSH